MTSRIFYNSGCLFAVQTAARIYFSLAALRQLKLPPPFTHAEARGIASAFGVPQSVGDNFCCWERYINCFCGSKNFRISASAELHGAESAALLCRRHNFTVALAAASLKKRAIEGSLFDYFALVLISFVIISTNSPSGIEVMALPSRRRTETVPSACSLSPRTSI